jgi:maltose O-acetyltransferase
MLVVWWTFVTDRLRGFLYSLFLRKSGKGLRIAKSAFLSGLSNIEIGDNVYINKGCILIGGGGITIGDNTLLGPYVQIYSEEHNKYDFKKPYQEKIVIGPNCWLCANVIVLKGSIIPEKTIVPAGQIWRK